MMTSLMKIVRESLGSGVDEEGAASNQMIRLNLAPATLAAGLTTLPSSTVEMRNFLT